MSSQVHEFIQTLVNNNETKMSLCNFFKTVHQELYSNYDISFMEYFLELTAHEGDFVVHHEKLIEYGIVTSNRSSNMKQKLDGLSLIEDIDYHLLDIQQMVRPQGGGKRNNIYMLIPEAFKNCLLRARKYPNQKVDPKVYSRYYLLLEKTYKLYTDYEKQLLSIQLEHQARRLEQQSQELEDQKNHVLRLNEMLIDSSNIPKTQVVYIATSSAYANQNRFKVGGVESLDKLTSRLSVYNTGSANGDLFYYAEWFLVHNYKEIESRLKDLMGRFRDQKSKEMYVVHYTKLLYILEYLVNNYNEEIDVVNAHLAEFISSLDKRNLKPVVPKEKCLKSIKIKTVGQPDVKIEANTDLEIVNKLEDHFRKMDSQVTSVTFKNIFDALNIKRDRLQLYSKLLEIGGKIRPDVVVKKK